MKATGCGSRQWLRPSSTGIATFVAVLSILARGHAFAQIGRPMSIKHRVSGSAGLSRIDASAGRGRCAAPRMTAGSSGEEDLGFVEKVTVAWGTVIEQ
ncbi:unnamed protein product, partial [Hapterophycus canaliculatus]